jgi:uncharacterized Zn finger protein (UPF0148 family)
VSITITTDVFCDVCGDWVDGVSSTKPLPKKALSAAKRDGWIRVKRDGKTIDVCPKCQEQELHVAHELN